MLDAGSTAPAFDLPSSTGDRVRLADFAGKTPVVLVFYPFSFSPVCEGELCAVRDDPASFETNGAKVMAVSADSSFVQAQWAEEKGFDFPVLSDFWPHGEVARAYGVFNEALGCASRGTFVIGTDGTVVASFASSDLKTPRAKSEYEAALAKL